MTLTVVLFYRIDLIGEATNSAAGRRFFRTGLEIAFSTLCSAYCGILTFADGVGGIPVFIANAITVASLSFSSRYDRRLRQASLAMHQRGSQKGYLPAWSVMRPDGWRVFLRFRVYGTRICSTFLHHRLQGNLWLSWSNCRRTDKDTCYMYTYSQSSLWR